MEEALNLGRVSTSASVVRSTAPVPEYRPTALDGLMDLGKTIAGGLVKEQKKKEFYEGQDRILQASLEGTQKEELQRIIDEQPYYMQILGQGATADGAVEMASRVGAGRIFDTQLSRLATGQDADVDPDTYKAQVMEQVTSQRTGNERVDSVFMPQMITKAQGLMATHLTKHLELNAKTAMHNTVTESHDALTTLSNTVKQESGDPSAAFPEGTPRELMTPAVGVAYDALVNTFNPATRPLNVTEDGWLGGKLALAIPAMEQGDTAIYQAMQESGMYGRLTAEDRVKADAARIKGRKENDSHAQMGMLAKEVALTEKVLRAKTDADIKAVEQEAVGIYQSYIKSGITPPDYIANSTAIKQFVFRAVGNKEEYLTALANKRERLSALTSAKVSAMQDEDKLDAAILNNALGDNASADVFLTTSDGNAGFVTIDKEDLKRSYSRKKHMLMESSPEARKQWLDKNNLPSIEALAYKYGIVDTATQDKLTQTLKLVSGKTSQGRFESKGKPNADADRIGVAMALIDSLKSSLTREGVAEYVSDEGLRKDLDEYMDAVDTTGDVMGAWEASFGRDKSQVVEFVAKDLDTALATGDVKDVIKESGIDSLVVSGWLRSEAVRTMESRHAQDPKEAVKQALTSLAAHTEIIGDTRVLGVPPQHRIGAKLGVRNAETVSALTDLYVRSTIPLDYTYAIDFDPRTETHLVIPQDKEGRFLMLDARPLDYKAIKVLLNSPSELKKAKEKTKYKSDILLNSINNYGDGPI